MKSKNIILGILIVLVLIFIPYSLIMRAAFYRISKENLVLKDSIYRMKQRDGERFKNRVP